jgi:hypothetical protein
MYISDFSKLEPYIEEEKKLGKDILKWGDHEYTDKKQNILHYYAINKIYYIRLFPLLINHFKLFEEHGRIFLDKKLPDINVNVYKGLGIKVKKYIYKPETEFKHLRVKHMHTLLHMEKRFDIVQSAPELKLISLEQLYKESDSGNFEIKYKGKRVPLRIFKLPNNSFSIVFRTSQSDGMLPIWINFSKMYIENIHKTSGFTGSELIKISLELCKLGSESPHLHDRALIDYWNLSTVRYIRKGKTFYQEFGFKSDINLESEAKIIRTLTMEKLKLEAIKILDQNTIWCKHYYAHLPNKSNKFWGNNEKFISATRDFLEFETDKNFIDVITEWQVWDYVFYWPVTYVGKVKRSYIKYARLLMKKIQDGNWTI